MGGIAYHDGAAVAAALDFPALIDHLRASHRRPAAEIERLLMTQPTEEPEDNGFLILPAWEHGRAMGIKVITVFPANTRAGAGRPSIQALYLLFDGTDGTPLAVLDGTELTYWKTAADSALAADYLARRDARTLLLVGAGGLAPYVIRGHLAARPGLQNVLIWNRTAAKAEQLAAQWAGAPRPQPASDLEEAAREADIISCATNATEPLIRGDWLRPGCHLDLIGSYTPEMREADDAAVRRARLFVDSRATTIEHVGDLTRPIAGGIIGPEDVEADLFDLCGGRHPGRGSEDEVTLFKSGGGGHLDLMTAQHVCERILGQSL